MVAGQVKFGLNHPFERSLTSMIISRFGVRYDY